MATASLKKACRQSRYFDDVIGQLLARGRLQAISAEDQQTGSPFHMKIQRICVCYGIAFSRAMPSSVFVRISDIFQLLTDDCNSVKATSQLLQDLVDSDVRRHLQSAARELKTLIDAETLKDGKFIQFATFFSEKTGVRQLRSLLTARLR